MVDRAHAAMMDGDMTCVILIDINPAFASVEKQTLLNEEKAKHIDGDLIWWTEDFLFESMVLRKSKARR